MQDSTRYKRFKIYDNRRNLRIRMKSTLKDQNIIDSWRRGDRLGSLDSSTKSPYFWCHMISELEGLATEVQCNYGATKLTVFVTC